MNLKIGRISLWAKRGRSAKRGQRFTRGYRGSWNLSLSGPWWTCSVWRRLSDDYLAGRKNFAKSHGIDLG